MTEIKSHVSFFWKEEEKTFKISHENLDDKKILEVLSFLMKVAIETNPMSKDAIITDANMIYNRIIESTSIN